MFHVLRITPVCTPLALPLVSLQIFGGALGTAFKSKACLGGNDKLSLGIRGDPTRVFGVVLGVIFLSK